LTLIFLGFIRDEAPRGLEDNAVVVLLTKSGQPRLEHYTAAGRKGTQRKTSFDRPLRPLRLNYLY